MGRKTLIALSFVLAGVAAIVACPGCTGLRVNGYTFVDAPEVTDAAGRACGETTQGIKVKSVAPTFYYERKPSWGLACPDMGELSRATDRLAKRMEVDPDVFSGWVVTVSPHLFFSHDGTPIWGQVLYDVKRSVMTIDPERIPPRFTYPGFRDVWLHEMCHVALKSEDFPWTDMTHWDDDLDTQCLADAEVTPSLDADSKWRKWVRGEREGMEESWIKEILGGF